VVRAWARAVGAVTGSARRTPISRQEILLLLQTPNSGGELGNGELGVEEHQMIRRVFAITERSVKECMTPLVEVDGVPSTAMVRDAVEVAVKNGHSRLPVYEGRIDHIVGVVLARDLLFGTEDRTPIRELLHTARHVPGSKRVDELLQEMRREREPFAVVVDEYGGAVGIITVEDLLEEIIGEIQDERESDELGIRRLSETEWRVPARVEVAALERAIGERLPEGDYETVAGLLLANTGRIPVQGEIVQIGAIRFRIEQSNERALQSVLVRTGGAARRVDTSEKGT
jgi:CBS domain containing-hemolysin-like protein